MVSRKWKFWPCGLLGLSGVFLLWGCSNSTRRAEADFVDFIGHYEQELSPLEKSIQEARWQYAVSGTEDVLNVLDSLVGERQAMMHDKRAFGYLRELRESESIRDPFLRRQLELLYRDYLPCQVDLALQDSILSLELELKATTLDRMLDPEMQRADKILRTSLNENDLKQAWLYVKQPGPEMGGRYRELVRLRNRAARQDSPCWKC